MKSNTIRHILAVSAIALIGCGLTACKRCPEPQTTCPSAVPVVENIQPSEVAPVPAAAPAPAANPAADAAPQENQAMPEAQNGAKVGVKSRSEIDPKFLWKKDRLFASVEEFNAALDAVPEDIKTLDVCNEFVDGEHLKSCLDLYFALHTNINKLTLYANMVNDTEPSPESKAGQQKALAALNTFMDKATVIRKALFKIDKDTLAGYISNVDGLKQHEAYINNLMRRADRVLTDDAERVLSLAGDLLWAEIDLNEIRSNSEDVFDAMRSEMDLPIIKDEAGKPVQLTLSNYAKYRRSSDREIRKSAVNGLMDTLAKYQDVFATAYVGQLKNDILFARARNYDTALEAFLDKDDIPVEIYKNLIDTIDKNLEPLHRYVSLRKKMLNLDAVHLYDMYIPITESTAPEKKYSYDDAVQLITTALAPLGEDYLTKIKGEMDLEKGSIDLLPYANKTSGAYSCSVYGIDPFILLNYQESLDDVSTLAHELGHSVHSLYSQEQPAGSYHYTMFLAEIASTTNEALLNDYLYKNAQTDAEKIDLLVDKLENIRTTIYRQALFAEFEYITHTAVENGEAVNAKWLSEQYAKLINKYYGPDYTIQGNEAYEWSSVPHFYYKYYVYSYATGLSSALSFANLIQQGPENAEKYITMLKSGCSRPSVDLLRDAGVDLATPAPIEFALNSFNEALTELEKLLAK